MHAALVASTVGLASAGTCCWSTWGDESTCGNYPSGGSGPICGNDGVTVCQSSADCSNPQPPIPSPTPVPMPVPTPVPVPMPVPVPAPVPVPVPVPPTPPTPSPSSLPAKILGMYVLVADDAHPPYTNEYDWTPQLYPYQQVGTNVVFLTFLHPGKMPAVPPGMASLAQSRGTGKPGAIPSGTTVLFAIGGQAYSSSPNPWEWLTSQAKAEAMAAEVAQWPEKYGCDGIDLDIETGAGGTNSAGANLVFFIAKLKELSPKMIITQPVFGGPSEVPAANRMLEASYNEAKGGGAAFGSLSKVGIMVYSGTSAEGYLDNYVNGCNKCTQWFCPVDACVPQGDMVLGASGAEAAGTISTLANDVNSNGLGGIMVWYSSALDPSTGSGGLLYGNMDASAAQLGAWATALKVMQNSGVVV